MEELGALADLLFALLERVSGGGFARIGVITGGRRGLGAGGGVGVIDGGQGLGAGGGAGATDLGAGRGAGVIDGGRVLGAGGGVSGTIYWAGSGGGMGGGLERVVPLPDAIGPSCFLLY